MNKNICLTAILGIALFASCSKDVEEVQFDPSVKIQFTEGGDSSIVHVPKGTMSMPINVNVTGTGPVIQLFEIYSADAKTGSRGALLTSQAFPNREDSYTASYTVTSLTDNKSIKVVVTDTLQRTYEKNILLKITPAVIFSDTRQMETVENYYGPYFATWLSGKTYMRNTQYASQIDFSIGDVALTTGSTTLTPSLVNPSMRASYNLLTTTGLQSTKFALTTMTAANYNAVTKVDAKPITDLPDPTLDAVALQAGKVYVFKTANGKKGLIHVASLAGKTGTIENTSGQWIPATAYSEIAVTTKTVTP